MFGIIYTALMTLGLIGHQVNNTFKEIQNIKEGERKKKEGKNFANVYYDYRGGLRSLQSGKRVSIDNLSEAESDGRDCFMRDIYGNPIRNMSEELRQQTYDEAKKLNDPRRTVCKWKRGITSNLAGVHGRPYYSGPEYKDLNNGAIYVCRMLPIPEEISGEFNSSGTFYMDIKNGLLVREADSQIEERRRGNYTLSEKINKDFITFFNQKQSADGYINHSKKPWGNPDDEESELFKRARLKCFYCNEYDISD